MVDEYIQYNLCNSCVNVPVILRVHGESQEKWDPSAHLDQRGHEEREELWASLDQKETRGTWALLDHP